MDPTYTDLEKNLDQEVEQIVRMGFIRKVYGVVCAQLVLTAGIIALAFTDVYKAAVLNYYALGAVIVFYIVLTCVLFCNKNLCRQVPINYILTTIWTTLFAVMISYTTMFFEPETVLMAAGGTAIITGGLTAYACTTKTDFTWMGGLLVSILMCMIIFVIFAFCFGFNATNNWMWSVLVIFLFSIFLVYDTQLVMGQFGLAYDTDDYIFAAVNIYIDIMRIFLEVLKLLGKK